MKEKETEEPNSLAANIIGGVVVGIVLLIGIALVLPFIIKLYSWAFGA